MSGRYGDYKGIAGVYAGGSIGIIPRNSCISPGYGFGIVGV